MTAVRPAPHTAEIAEILESLSREHGPVARMTASTVWDFGVAFEDGYRTRIAMPRGTTTDAAELHAWVRETARAAGATYRTAF